MHRPRRRIVTSSVPSTFTTHSSSTGRTTHPRPTLGGNVGFGDGNGGTVPPITTPSTSTSTLPPTSFTTPIFTTDSTPIPQKAGNTEGNRGGNVANGGLGSNTHPSTLPATSGFILSTASSLPSPTSSSEASQSGQAKISDATSINLTGPTASPVDSSATTSNSQPAQTTSSIPTSPDSHRDISPGIIAGIIGFLICLILILAIFLHRKRKAARNERETSGAKTNGETVTDPGPSTHPQHDESALVFTSPYSPSDTNHTPTSSTSRSPRWLADSNSDISQLSLPPPPMVETDDRARAVPTLVLDTSRYRRSHHANPIDSWLSVATTGSGDSRRFSRSHSHNLFDGGSPVSPRSLSPSEAFSQSKPPLSTHSSGFSSRSPSQMSLQVPPSPTNLRVPPSPRTPTRTHIYIPPIPPLPKSPPPVPGSYTNPFVDRDPFDDPAG